MKYLICVLLLAVGLTSSLNIGRQVQRLNKPNEQLNKQSTAANNTKVLINNSFTTTAGQSNFHVGLNMKMNKFSKTRWCGGSLISPEWILTAAHYTNEAISIIAYVGSKQQKSGTEVTILSTIIHCGFNATTLVNDISLLRIAPVTLGPNINIGKLPALTSYRLYPEYMYEKVIASGWGYVNNERDPLPELLHTRLQIIPKSLCYKYYVSAFKSSNICVQGPEKISTCQGDSGGPLVTETNETLIGVTSFVDKICCAVGYPKVFTRVSSYRSWIMEQTGI